MRRVLANSSSNSVWFYQGVRHASCAGVESVDCALLTAFVEGCSLYSGSLIPSNLSIALSWLPLTESRTDWLGEIDE